MGVVGERVLVFFGEEEEEEAKRGQKKRGGERFRGSARRGLDSLLSHHLALSNLPLAFLLRRFSCGANDAPFRAAGPISPRRKLPPGQKREALQRESVVELVVD